MQDAIRIFIGTEPKTALAQKVLEHSILRRTIAKVSFQAMTGRAWEYSTKDIKVGTGFSLRRWMIPSACEWDGYAIYLDADQIVFGDIAELWNLKNKDTVNGNQIWCTYQADKFSASAWPQTSVMLIDCRAALAQAGHWRIDQIRDRLLKNNNQAFYADLMHAKWMDPQPLPIPTCWNHLNVFDKTSTRLLHYTKEPEQPWYKPSHPLAPLWEAELKEALRTGYVTPTDLKEALARWGKQEDWRKTNGLHPHYRKFLASAKSPEVVRRTNPLSDPRVEKRPGTNKASNVLWVTSFAADMFRASGSQLLDTFMGHDVLGKLFVATEGFDTEEMRKSLPENADGKYVYHDITADPWLLAWLEKNADVIPEHLGGKNTGKCECPGGPFEVHDKRHVMPCIGHWFNRNASRWLRKIVAQRRAVGYAADQGFSHMIWLDADCYFKRRLVLRNVLEWFRKKALFYLKSKRAVMEAGVLGFDLTQNGDSVIWDVVKCYENGNFRKHARWDDSAVYQKFIQRTKVSTVDIAMGVGAHAAVVPHSPLHLYLAHDKGRHGRKLKLMT